MINSKKIILTYLVLAFSCFILLAIRVRSTLYFPIDLTISRQVQAITLPNFSNVMKFFSNSGWGLFSYSLIFSISLILAFLGKRLAGLFVILNVLIEVAVFYAVALLVNRPRPTPDLIRVDFKIGVGGFPSGHVLMYMVVFGFLIFLTLIYIKKVVLKSILIGVCVSVLLVIGLARIYSGQHWPTDILGAYLLGSILVSVSIYFYQKVRGQVRSVFPKLFPKSQEIL